MNIAKTMALCLHKDQRYGNEPYVNHLEEVVNECRVHVSAGPDALSVVTSVAWLHDAVEDCGINENFIADQFVDDYYDEFIASAIGCCSNNRCYGNGVWRHFNYRQHGVETKYKNIKENLLTIDEEWVKAKTLLGWSFTPACVAVVVKLADRICNVRRGGKKDKYKKEDKLFRDTYSVKLTDKHELYAKTLVSL